MNTRSVVASVWAVLAAGVPGPLARAANGVEAKNMELLAHDDLKHHGDGGEGMALQLRADGRRILYVAHEGNEVCLSVVDVTDPRAPRLLNQLPSPGPGVTRCNSLGLSGNVLAVANQTRMAGGKPAGMWLLDVSDPVRVQRARALDDLRLAFFDTSGPSSRGVHWLWFADGEFVHLSTGAADFSPTNPRDDQLYMVVDARDPSHPREVGRWWLPGTRTGDACLPGCLPERQRIDDGYRAHNVEVFPQRPDRAYVGYIDGGAITLDIGGLADVRSGRSPTFTPRLVSRLDYSPPFPAWTHTVQPLFERRLAIVSDEAVQDRCRDAPKLIWVVDIRDEANPVIVATAPSPANVEALCTRGGVFGAHNLHPNLPSPTSAQLANTFVGTFFNGGVRIYRLVATGLPGAPPTVEEIGYFIPPPPQGGARPIQINHVLVDERRVVYAVDRVSGGLYVLKYTGSVPLD